MSSVDSENEETITTEAKKKESTRLFSDDSSSESDTEKKKTSNGSKGNDSNAQEKTGDLDMSQLFGSDLDSDDEEEQEFKSNDVIREEREENDTPNNAVGNGGILPPVSLVLPDAPRIPAGSKIIYAKTPNMICIESDCYRPEDYPPKGTQEDPNEEDSNVDKPAGDDGSLEDNRHYVRWRYIRDEAGEIAIDSEGLPLRESNTKLVRWSDGSLHLFIGNQAFNVSERQIHNTYTYIQHEKMGDNGESCLECHGAIQQKMTFRPAQNLSQLRRALANASRHKVQQKVSKMQEYISGSDPDVDKRSRAKIQDDQLRIKAKKKHKEEFESDRVRNSRMDANFLEGGFDDEDEGNLASIKNRYKSGKPPRHSSNIGGFDEYERGMQEDEAENRLMRAKRRSDLAKKEEEDEEEDEEEMVSRRPTKRRALVDDDEDEDN